MDVSRKLIKQFDSINKCYFPLLKHEITTCVKCDNKKFYTSIEKFEKTCKNCKTRYKITFNTLFHNVRFGLLKAFHIYIEIIYKKPQPRASELARRYNLTYKTAYNFKNKVIDNNSFIDLEFYLMKNQLSDEEKLYDYIVKTKNLWLNLNNQVVE